MPAPMMMTVGWVLGLGRRRASAGLREGGGVERARVMMGLQVRTSARNEGRHRLEVSRDVAGGGEPRRFAVRDPMPLAEVTDNGPGLAQPGGRHRRKEVMLDVVVHATEQKIVQSRGAEVACDADFLHEKGDRLVW